MPLDSEWHLLSNIEMLPEADLMALDEDLRWDQDIQQTSSTGISGGLSHPCTLPLPTAPTLQICAPRRGAPPF